MKPTRKQNKHGKKPSRNPHPKAGPKKSNPTGAKRGPSKRPVRRKTTHSVVRSAPHEERLQKVLAAAGYGSRRACEEIIEHGRVTVDGETVQELGTRVNANVHKICVDGKQIQAEVKVYWWLNKPPGVLSTAHDPQGRPTVLDLVPDTGTRLYPVGRLDEESVGLMLLTNDGSLAERLTHPRYGVPKTYEVLAAGKVSRDVCQKLCEGIWLSDGRVRAAAAHKLGLQGTATKLRIVLREGHNREIRRMLARFGHKVMRLERVAIGPVKVRKLATGQSRPATAEEIEMLRETAMNAKPLPPAKRDVQRPSRPSANQKRSPPTKTFGRKKRRRS